VQRRIRKFPEFSLTKITALPVKIGGGGSSFKADCEFRLHMEVLKRLKGAIR
jgi:hypothetical protein